MNKTQRLLSLLLTLGIAVTTGTATVARAQQSSGGRRSNETQSDPSSQQAGGRRSESQAIVSVPNTPYQVEYLGSNTWRLHSPEQTWTESGSNASTAGWTQSQVTGGRPSASNLPGGVLNTKAPLGPPVPTLEQLGFSRVGPVGAGTFFENPRNPSDPQDPGGAILIIPPAEGTGPTPPVVSGRYNVRSTRRDWRSIARQSADGIWRSPPLPSIGIGINPNPGLVALQSWFWIQGYQNAPLVPSLHLDLPWTLSWDQDVTHSETTACPTDDDPEKTCTSSVTVTEHSNEPHLDQIDVTVTFTPATYTWDFGDGRKGSHLSFDPATGVGRAYTDPYTPSPVAWSYESDSRDFVGGFPVMVTVTWGVSAHLRGSSDIGDGFDVTAPLADRSATWGAQHVVCQIQALRTAPGAQINAVPCRDNRIGR